VSPHPICEPEWFSDRLSASDVVFNLAGEISHVHSMDFPERDMQINAVAQLQVSGGVRTPGAGSAGGLCQHAPGLRRPKVSAGG